VFDLVEVTYVTSRRST